MPTKSNDRNTPDRSAEGKERRKVKVSRKKTSTDSVRRRSQEREHDRDKRDKERTRSEVSDERGSVVGSTGSQRRVSAPIPELERRGSPAMNGSRVSLPYPAFSKEHSREAVRSKESLASSKLRRATPDAGDADKKARKSDKANDESTNDPLTPPMTAEDQISMLEEKRRRLEKESQDMREQLEAARKAEEGKSTTRMPSHSSLREAKADRAGRSPPRRAVSHQSIRPKKSAQAVVIEESSSVMSPSRTSSPLSRHTDSMTKPTVASSIGSSGTQKAARQSTYQTPFSPDADDEASPYIDDNASFRTPTPRGTPLDPARKHTPAFDVPSTNQSSQPGFEAMPPPPPPPPPPMMNVQPPRVDYLLQHGGLNQIVPKHYLDITDPLHARPFSQGELPDTSLMKEQVERFFHPFSNLLQNYSKVMEKSGSVAVATGYRSIARRLLDRLEAVFARDISSEICDCTMCEQSYVGDLEDLEATGISWGEILEFVSGRRELPPWPPFVFDDEPVGLGILEQPMQKLDIDVPEEYRDHYIKQSKKTKSSVDRWLAGQTTTSAAPEEADDDTLTFAMLTRLDEVQRPIFKKLLGVSDTRPPSVHPLDKRAPTPLNAPKSPLLARTAHALQRLYRLTNSPRPPESAVFLVRHAHLHNVLATLAAVSDHEWDILTSGRFDGFLWSGADDTQGGISSVPPSRGPTPAIAGRTSRGATATPGPRPSTPGAPVATGVGGAPVALDEETEIQVLAEVERDIYLGMEALEDAFEALHQQAEAVRVLMRERSAGLSMAQAARRGSSGETLEARLGTPASGYGGTPVNGNWDGQGDEGDNESMFGGVDGRSELGPDDSASNISGVRKYKRKKRGEERRTPAPIVEESLSELDDAPRHSYRKR